MSNYKKFQNTACEYFPCHQVEDEEAFNCMFCYCPLYMLKEDCGGDFIYLESGIKSCVKCTKPHVDGGYEYIQDGMNTVIECVKRQKK